MSSSQNRYNKCIFASMGRLLAIDYGGKRCGIAVTDLNQVFAFGHDTVSTSDLLDYLKDYTQKENVEGIVVGMPKRLHNQSFRLFSSIPMMSALLQKSHRMRLQGQAPKNKFDKTKSSLIKSVQPYCCSLFYHINKPRHHDASDIRLWASNSSSKNRGN